MGEEGDKERKSVERMREIDVRKRRYNDGERERKRERERYLEKDGDIFLYTSIFLYHVKTDMIVY